MFTCNNHGMGSGISGNLENVSFMFFLVLDAPADDGTPLRWWTHGLDVKGVSTAYTDLHSRKVGYP